MTTTMTPLELKDCIVRVAGGALDGLSSRPWNRFQPDESLWWLVPSKSWPAYPHAKWFFTWPESTRAHLRCGLHVEKGLGPNVASVYPKSKSLIMDVDWAWSRFVTSMAEGALVRALRSAADREFAISVDGGYISEPDAFDPYGSMRQLPAWYEFAVGEAAGACSLESHEDTEPRMAALRSAASLETLGLALGAVSENPWLWVNLWISTTTDDSEAPDQLWARLKPLASML